MYVYLLWHTHSSDEYEDDSKLLGVYSTEERAQARIERSRDIPGFRDQLDGFHIASYEIDKDEWTAGYHYPGLFTGPFGLIGPRPRNCPSSRGNCC